MNFRLTPLSFLIIAFLGNVITEDLEERWVWSGHRRSQRASDELDYIDREREPTTRRPFLSHIPNDEIDDYPETSHTNVGGTRNYPYPSDGVNSGQLAGQPNGILIGPGGPTGIIGRQNQAYPSGIGGFPGGLGGGFPSQGAFGGQPGIGQSTGPFGGQNSYPGQFGGVQGQPGYPTGQFGGSQFPGNHFGGGQFPLGQYPGTQFHGGQAPGQYPIGQLGGAGQYPGGQFQGGQFAGGQFPGHFTGGQFPGGQFPGGQFAGGQLPSTQFQGGQFPGNQLSGFQGSQLPIGQFPGSQFTGTGPHFTEGYGLANALTNPFGFLSNLGYANGLNDNDKAKRKLQVEEKSASQVESRKIASKNVDDKINKDFTKSLNASK